jgi:hypothetical protein
MASIETPIGILSFPVLFTPKPRAPGGEPTYQLNLLFDKSAQATPAYANLRKAVADAIKEEWGPQKLADKDFMRKLRLPFRRCKEKSYEGYDIEDGIYIAPWSKNRPGLIDARRNEISVPGDIWAGQMARATVSPFAYAQSGNMGVNFGLNNVQICRTDGKRLDGRRAAKDEFGDYDDGLGGSMGGDDEDMPF